MSTPLPQDLDGVRKQPTPRTALIVFIGYLAVIVGVNLITARDFDFGDVAANASNTRNGIVLPILAASRSISRRSPAGRPTSRRCWARR